jgi:CheY-like chemotaxis protein
MKPRLFQIKTHVAFLDDQIDYIRLFEMETPRIQSLIWDQPEEALKAIQAFSSTQLLNRFIRSEEESQDQTATASLHIQEIADLLINPPRLFHAVVVDYNMPALTGIEFCQRLDDPLLKKIILTGELDGESAIESMNQGIFTVFMRKMQVGLLGTMETQLETAQDEFFAALSERLLLLLKDTVLEQLYRRPDFWEFFETLLQTYRIVQFALCDTNGSFKMIDANDAIFFLNAYTQSEMAHVIPEMDGFGNLSTDNRQSIRSLEKILDCKIPGTLQLDPDRFQDGFVEVPDSIFKLSDDNAVLFKLRQ